MKKKKNWNINSIIFILQLIHKRLCFRICFEHIFTKTNSNEIKTSINSQNQLELLVYIFRFVNFLVKLYKDNCIHVYTGMIKDIISNFLSVKYLINIRSIKLVYKIRNNALSLEVDWKGLPLRECIGIV